MKLLATTSRYYLLLATVLLVVGSLALYYGISQALRTKTDEQLAVRQQELIDKAHTNQLPSVDVLSTLLVISRQPQPGGFHDTLLLDAQQQKLVPHRQLTFPLTMRGENPVWVTLRKSQVAPQSLLGVVLGVMAGVLVLLLGGMVLLNRWLERRMWKPFRHSLAALGGYNLQQRQPLALPIPAMAELAELNQALNNFSQRLVADCGSLREFTARAAHETQVPLATMQAQLEQLLQVPALAEDPTAAPLVACLYRTALRLSHLHEALSLLSKIENRQFPQAQPIALNQLLEDQVAQMEPLFDARELRYGLDISTEPIVLTMHPGLADALLQNLLQNAVKHNLRGGEVAISLTPQALKISNTSPDATSDPAQFFEQFRKHNGASEAAGLGLSIVRQICDYYGFGLDYTVSEVGTRHTIQVALHGAAVAPARKPVLA